MPGRASQEALVRLCAISYRTLPRRSRASLVPLPPLGLHTPGSTRLFTTTPVSLATKRNRKLAEEAGKSPDTSYDKTGHRKHSDPKDAKAPPNVNVSDSLGELKKKWKDIEDIYKAKLQPIATGGRFNDAVLGQLPVNVKSETGELQAFPLKELAQVVPRGGRNISLLLNDKEYAKPVISAVQASQQFNQQPQRSPDNEFELTMRVEMEKKEDLARQMKDTCHEWVDKIRHARTEHDKMLKEWHSGGWLLKDALKMALTKVQEAQNKEIKAVTDKEKEHVKRVMS